MSAEFDFELPEGLELGRVDGRLTLAGDGMELAADFRELLPRVRHDRLGRELLVKAARVKGEAAPTAFDATAGLGEDSLLLAAAGFSVTMCESDPVIAALLADALSRAAEDPELAGIVARMTLVQGDSVELLPRLASGAGCVGAGAGGAGGEGTAAGGAGDEGAAAGGASATGALALAGSPDVVYLDPMFPARTKSAAVKKKFQLLHRLETPCANEDELMAAALAAKPRKVVVKRPIKAPVLAGVRPSHSIQGKAVRYDVIVPPRG